MTAFRIYLGALVLGVVVYTVQVIAQHGWGLMAIYFDAIRDGGWPGQFNLDFMGFLSLSALWLAWRHHFTPAGLGLGLLGFFGGTPVLAAYLLVASFKARGDVRVLLLGAKRAAITA
jgi:hypothetical protein